MWKEGDKYRSSTELERGEKGRKQAMAKTDALLPLIFYRSVVSAAVRSILDFYWSRNVTLKVRNIFCALRCTHTWTHSPCPPTRLYDKSVFTVQPLTSLRHLVTSLLQCYTRNIFGHIKRLQCKRSANHHHVVETLSFPGNAWINLTLYLIFLPIFYIYHVYHLVYHNLSYCVPQLGGWRWCDGAAAQ